MKSYKFLIPILLVIVYGVSIYVLYSGRLKIQQEYDTYLKIAREKREQEIQVDAKKYYLAALDVKTSLELYIEIGEYYQEIGKMRDATNWGEEMLSLYPNEAGAYEYMMDIYMKKEDYISFYDLYDTMQSRKVKSNVIEKTKKEIEYKYYISGSEYNEVSSFGYGACAVKGETKWGFVNESGSRVIGLNYQKVGPFCDSLAPVVTMDGDAYFIDTSGNKKKIVENVENIKELGMIENGVFALYNGVVWGFYKEDGTKIAGDYDDVSNMANGCASVMSEGKWRIINSNGEIISKDEYAEVITDERKIICRYDRIFVRIGDECYMLDSSCNKVTEEKYQSADIFRAGTLAAVQIDEKWGFIDSSGKVVIEPQYEAARSFSNGYAAVQIDEKWGFINEDGDLVIQPTFDQAKDFTSTGTVFIKDSGVWKMLLLYKDNH